MSFDFGRTGGRSIVTYETLSSTNSKNNYDRPERLHEWLKAEDIETLHKVFRAQPNQKLSLDELRDELKNFDINFTDVEYKRLFLKINQNSDFKCDWNEFLSYIIYGFQDDDQMQQNLESLVLPISHPPLVKKSEHRSPIVSLTFLKSITDGIKQDDESDDSDEKPENRGLLVSASKEGQIKFWTTELDGLRSCVSESAHSKMPTWILCIQSLSDVAILCTSSTERELRFHETTASTFNLRIVIRTMPMAICCMSYTSHPTKQYSRLIMGDYGGNIRILEFSTFLRGPFQAKAGSYDVFWSDILKGKVPAFSPKEYLNIHSGIIMAVYFSIRINGFFAAAEYRNSKKYRGRCPGLISICGEDVTTYRIPMGCSTFYIDERENILVAGSPDAFVRIWDIFIPQKPIAILSGHNSGIVKVFVQSEEKKVYSVDYQKIIKVWHLTEHTLLQTFGDLARILPTETELTYKYNAKHRDLLVGGRKFIAIKCCPRVRVDLTDGNSHAAAVTVVLYNKLFRNVVTCGLDSNIIIWDPWTGRRKLMMRSCHTKTIYGEIVDIEITAGCFDPLEQFLLTGARDGSLKIWNYNNAVCIRNMSIRAECEVTAVMWVLDRILAVGWDRKVTEFNDIEGREYGDAKIWPTFHDDDITCADVKYGDGIVTATYSGEIIFWKLETGQPYRKYSVSFPKKFIELSRKSQDADTKKTPSSLHLNVNRYVRESVTADVHLLESKWRQSDHAFKSKSHDLENISEDIAIEKAKKRRSILKLSVQSILFLQARPMTQNHGTVFVSLDTGIIQVYSHHQRGGYLAEFYSIHRKGDCVLTMTSDRKNRYLFTGTAFGYIKIWHIENFCKPEEEKKYVCMPLLRLQFIFLRKERMLTRAKRVIRHQKEPLLVSSYRGHLKAVKSIIFINLPKILLSGSYDSSCRMWSLGGRYLGTLGSPLPAMRLSPFDTVDEETISRMPPDIKKVASSTTIKVITGVQHNPNFKKFIRNNSNEAAVNGEDPTSANENKLREPILGKYFLLPGKSAQEQSIQLDASLSYVPVFNHLKIYDADKIDCPATPPIIEKVKREEYMNFYSPVTTKTTKVPDFRASSVQWRKSTVQKTTRFTDTRLN